MLQVMRRGGGVREALLTAEHDAALRAAFGRAGRDAARSAGRVIVNEHQSVGRWFACDCLGDVKRPPVLDEFLERVSAMPAKAFRKTRNPHGLLLGVARSASRGVIVPTQGDPLAVAGDIAIFGERDGRDAGPGLSATRGPYLMLCLVGRRSPKARVEVLRAYLHPCMSESWLLPVDSNLERHSMTKMVAVGRWFRDQRDLALAIHKPLFDLAEPPQALSADAIEAHEPILPDFIAEVAEGAAVRRVVVETMGYADAAYRARKLRLKPEMARLGRGPVVEHDFHYPVEWSQLQRDEAFTLALRQALISGQPG